MAPGQARPSPPGFLGASAARRATHLYQGLHLTIGRRGISQFIERLARPHVVPLDIEAAYREMAADRECEQEALEWCEGLISDATPVEPDAAR